MKKSNRNAANHYFGQEVCDGWHLSKRDDVK